MTDADQGMRCLREARQWIRLVSARLGRGWRPTEAQSRICADVGEAGWFPARTPPPHDDEPLYVRIRRICQWAAVIRLGATAGGLTLTPAPPSDATADAGLLPGLLAALHQAALVAYEWREVDNERSWTDFADTWPTGEFPQLREQLVELERIFSGPGSIAEVFYVLATGEVEW